MTFTIREAVLDDREEIVIIEKESGVIHHEGEPLIFRDDREPFSKKEFQDILNDADQTLFAAVNEDGKVVGFLHARIERFRDSDYFTDHDRLHIESLAVLSSARRQGVGRALMKAAEERAAALGVQETTLHVWNFNEKAMALYASEGFRPLQTLMVSFNEEEK